MPALDCVPVDWESSTPVYLVDKINYFAKHLPLVRVFANNRDNPGCQTRRKEEIKDIFCNGVLKRSHKGQSARHKETQLNTADFLYFHAGRTHEQYGEGFIAFRSFPGELELSNTEATPFGLGNLCCPGSTSDTHIKGSCLSSISHEPIDVQIDFLKNSIWNLDWRKHAARFFSYYFQECLSNYFKEGNSGRPNLPDPDNIFSDPNVKDWRCWTIEVRLQDSDVYLKDAVVSDNILFWGIENSVYEDIMTDLWDGNGTLDDSFPWLVSLPINSRIALPKIFSSSLLRWANLKIEEHVLP